MLRRTHYLGSVCQIRCRNKMHRKSTKAISGLCEGRRLLIQWRIVYTWPLVLRTLTLGTRYPLRFWNSTKFISYETISNKTRLYVQCFPVVVFTSGEEWLFYVSHRFKTFSLKLCSAFSSFDLSALTWGNMDESTLYLDREREWVNENITKNSTTNSGASDYHNCQEPCTSIAC